MANDDGMVRLQKRFASIPEDVKTAVRPAIVKQAELMAATMRALVPVRTGSLRDSIVVTPPEASTPPYSQPGGATIVPEFTAAVTAGDVDVRYAHLVEYGHKASGFSAVAAPATPFFWPAVRLHNQKAKKAIKAAIRKAVRKSGSKT